MIVNRRYASRLTHTVWYLLMNIAASRDIRSTLKRYMKKAMYAYPIGIVKDSKLMLPFKALNKSMKESKMVTGTNLSSLLSNLPSSKKIRMISPKVKKNLNSSFFI